MITNVLKASLLCLSLSGCCTLGYDALVAKYQAEQEVCLQEETVDLEGDCIQEVRDRWRPVIIAIEGVQP